MPESISGVSGVGSSLQRGRFWPIGLLPFRACFLSWLANGTAGSAGTFFLTNVARELRSVPTLVKVWAPALPCRQEGIGGFVDATSEHPFLAGVTVKCRVSQDECKKCSSRKPTSKLSRDSVSGSWG